MPRRRLSRLGLRRHGTRSRTELCNMGKQTEQKYEIWLEDAKSIEPKLKLMQKYKLTGTAEVVFGTGKHGYLESDSKYIN